MTLDILLLQELMQEDDTDDRVLWQWIEYEMTHREPLEHTGCYHVLRHEVEE